ncbi:hypothetical protein MMC10_008305 [Thelotrema lepadinum]|nr:hypothetical protein [Thelotrema lepadinum]
MSSQEDIELASSKQNVHNNLKGDQFVNIPSDGSGRDSRSLNGVEYANATNDLRDRAWNAIQDFRAKNGLRSRNRVDQDIKPIDEFPNGYPKLAAIEASDDNFLIFKKFSWLRNWTLLYLQDELLVLQEDLMTLDTYDMKHDSARLSSRRRDAALDSRRKDLLLQIEQKLNRFDKLLSSTNQISKLETPSERNQTSLYNAIHNSGLQIQSEAEWIGDRADLVAVAPDQERSTLNALVEDCPKLISKRLATFLFRTKDQHQRTGAEEIYLYSNKRMVAVADALMTLIATILLLVPIGILALTQPSTILQLVVILCFTQLFALCIATLTKAKKQEVFALTATYTAVLVVFLANNNISINSSQLPTQS